MLDTRDTFSCGENKRLLACVYQRTSGGYSDFQSRSFIGYCVGVSCRCGTSLPESWQQAEVFEDWELDDPDGEPLDTFRRVRSEIKEHVEA